MRLRVPFLALLLASVAVVGVPSLAPVAFGAGASDTSSDPVIAAAGDIVCAPTTSKTKGRCHQQETSDLIAAGNYAAVLPVGDEQYNCGELSAFNTEYGPTWGRFNAKAYPVPGDDEYSGSTCTVPGAAGYYGYFGNRASPTQPGCTKSCSGYYSYDIGQWHVVALNSECTQAGVGGCGATSPMVSWLKQDLAAHPNVCTLAYWHRPYWANGSVTRKYKPLVQTLYDGGADVVLAGHNHIYARFASQDPSGRADPNGLTQFTVGTGGVGHGPLSSTVLPNTQVRERSTFGILALTLHADSYDFKFVPDTTSGSFTDSGSGQCHGGGATPPTGQAPTVTTSPATGVTSSGATLTGSVNPNGAATTYRFEYGTSTSYGTSTADADAGSGASSVNVSAPVSGLDPATTYHYRLVATNSTGTSTGADGTFTTSSVGTGGTGGTVALWHMDEAQGATVMVDSSGAGNDGAINSDVTLGLIGGYSGTAYGFEQGAAMVRVPDSDSLDPGQAAITLSTYLRVPQKLPAGDYNAIQKGTATAKGGAYKLEIFGKSGKKFGFPACAFNGANGAKNRVYGPRSIADGQWHHVVCTLTAGSNAQAYATVDGVTGAKQSRAVDSIGNTSDLTIGGKPNSSHYYYGDADEVSISIG